MSDLVRRVTWDRQKKQVKLPEMRTGDSVGVYVKVKEGEKERVQLFSGVVIRIQGSGSGRSFTVRKMASGVGVERTFPMLSPAIDRVEIESRGKVRRSRLFFLRGLKGRSARLDSSFYSEGENTVGAADQIASAETAEASEGAVEAKAKAPKKEKKAKEPKANKKA